MLWINPRTAAVQVTPCYGGRPFQRRVTGGARYLAASGIQQLSTTADTACDSVCNLTRCTVVRPPSVPASAASGPTSRTFQPTTANLESRALTAHLAAVPGFLVTWKSISVRVASGVL